MKENVLKIPTMLTINEVAEKTGLAKFYIRRLALQNKVKNVRAGKKILINFEKLIEFLNGNDETTEVAPQIKKIEK